VGKENRIEKGMDYLHGDLLEVVVNSAASLRTATPPLYPSSMLRRACGLFWSFPS